MMHIVCFFFSSRRRHTRYWRDWSSDVCSSDLAQQRFLWWCGALMLASGAVHAVVAVVDGGPWWGAVTWRKPVIFGVSFGILAWSAVWVLRQLPVRRWGWVPVGLLGGASMIELLAITMQRWRGEGRSEEHTS